MTSTLDILYPTVGEKLALGADLCGARIAIVVWDNEFVDNPNAARARARVVGRDSEASIRAKVCTDSE